MTLQQAFDYYINSENFESSVISSTKAGWSGSGYSVELFTDGTYRILWDNNIGNLYNSEGLILKIDALNNDEWDDDGNHYFDNVRELMYTKFTETIEEFNMYNLEDNKEEDVNGGDCSDCGGTGAVIEKNEDGEYEATGDCETCDDSGDEAVGN